MADQQVDGAEAPFDEEAEWEAATRATPSDADGQGNGADDHDGQGDPDPDDEARGAAASSSQEGAEDPLAGLSPEMRARLETAERDAAKFRNNYNALHGRVAPLERQLAEARNENTQLKAGASDRKPVAERLAALREDFPEIGEVLEELNTETQQGLAELRQARAAEQAERQRDRDDSISAEIEKEHPGFEKLLDDHAAAFAEWVDDQPKKVRDAVARNNAGWVNAPEVVGIVSAFKQHLNPESTPAGDPATLKQPDPKRQRQLEALAGPSNRGKPSISAQTVDFSDDEAGWEYAVKDRFKKR